MTPEHELSASYATLSVSPAFLHLRAWLHQMVLQAEAEAVLTETNRPRAITRWQERRKIEIGIESLLTEQDEIRKAQEEELVYERGIERDRAARSGW